MHTPAPTPHDAEHGAASPRGHVVVGYDGSAASGPALAYAAAQASSRGLPLRIVSAFPVVVSELGMSTGFAVDAGIIDAVRQVAQDHVDEAAEHVQSRHPQLQVSTKVAPGGAAGILLDESSVASLLVLGSRGSTGIVGRLGSTSRQVATHSRAPTVVVKDAAPSGEVVVGVDGSADSLRAVAFAFDLASREGLPLKAVHAWDVPPIGALTGLPSPEPVALVQDLERAETRAAMEELAGFSARYPEVPMEPVIVRGAPVDVLVQQSAGAAMLVVGSRGHGGFLGLLLGSVSHGVLHHATCNVAVVRATA